MGSKREPEAEGGLLPLAAPGNFPDGAVRRAQKRGSVASCALFPNGLNLRSLSSAQATVRSYGTVSVSPMLSFAEPRLKDRQELLATTNLWRYCEDERPLLAYRNWYLSPEESLVHQLTLCRGGWREVYGTGAYTLFLLPPPRR